MNTFWIINLLNLFFLSTYVIYTLFSSSSSSSEHVNLNDVDYGDSPEIIESRGFNCETHKIVTSDGYILTMFRIVNPLIFSNLNDTDKLTSGKPVLLQSGLFGSSDDFIINSPDGYIDQSFLKFRQSYQSVDYKKSGRNLGFLLANLGYDVWLTNFRGNYYSRNHTTFDPNSSEFWSTGYDEMATIDLPMTIDYILAKTKKENVGYVGMSRGSAIMFALLSEKTEYSKKVKPFIAMAPAVYVKRKSRSYLRTFFELSYLSSYLLSNPSECFGRGFAKSILTICSYPMVDVLCLMARQPFRLMSSNQVNSSRVAIYFTHYPAGSPCWDIIHFNQVGSSNQFRKLDFGPTKNAVKYGQPEPPIYQLEKINSHHIFIISSTGDTVIHHDNVVRLVEHLKVKPKEWILVNGTDFNHSHFIHSIDAGVKIYKEIARILSEY
ncbi:gastric triacylglycerol lipase-like [Panonychus citri]|uniref:gastric triacylglycerol lipase-like n=1 Tax=Panonychus citri TaxID=50023 RepID=UPI002307C3DA|nr:gastric triacylglycerol lipase-like [Panonychus citri]